MAKIADRLEERSSSCRPRSPARFGAPIPGWLAVLALCLLATGLWSGCVSEPKSRKPAAASSGGGTIEEINLLAVPVALNLDDKPGLDGFAIKVYAGSRKLPKPIAIQSGKIEVLMYDGIPGVTEGASLEPRRVWTYTAAELKPFEIRTSIGTGYQLAPLWGDAAPTRNKITVVVRYISPEGRSITSAPSVISVTLN